MEVECMYHLVDLPSLPFGRSIMYVLCRMCTVQNKYLDKRLLVQRKKKTERIDCCHTSSGSFLIPSKVNCMSKVKAIESQYK